MLQPPCAPLTVRAGMLNQRRGNKLSYITTHTIGRIDVGCGDASNNSTGNNNRLLTQDREPGQ